MKDRSSFFTYIVGPGFYTLCTLTCTIIWFFIRKDWCVGIIWSCAMIASLPVLIDGIKKYRYYELNEYEDMKDRIYKCECENHFNNSHSYSRTSMTCYNLNCFQRFFLRLGGFDITRLVDEEEREQYLKLKEKYGE